MSNLWQSNPAYREQVAAERADERRRVIEELAREAEQGLYDEALVFEDADWKLAKQEGVRVAAWLRAHQVEEG